MPYYRSNWIAVLFVVTGAALVTTRANAQSSVTLYGILDTGVEYLSAAPAAGGKSANLYRETSGSHVSSRFGFKGVEDLGGGLKAIFTLESGPAMNNGTLLQGGRMFGRQAYVGLSSSYGQLTFGRQITPIYEYFLPLDPLNYSSYGLPAQDAQFIGRADNSVKYSGSFGPIDVSALYSFGYDATIPGGGPLPGAYRVGKQFDAGARYVQGPVNVSVVYEQRQGESVATAGKDEQRVSAGASYAFTSIQLFAGYEWYQSDIPATAQHQVMGFAGLRYRVTPALALAAAGYYHVISSASQRPLSIGLNADYSLSKRTSLYVDATHVSNSNGSNLGANGFGSSIAPGHDQTGVALGLVHRF
jgi:predicted porin